MSETKQSTAQLDGEVLADVVQRIHPVIWSTLGSLADPETVADVAQATWESAWRVRHRFDEDKGTLHAWVVTIARRRAVDHLRSVKRDRVLQEQAEEIATSRVGSSASLVADDHSTLTLDALEARQTLARVLSVVEDVISSREATARALALVLVFGDDLQAASRALGVSKDALRESRRELMRCCQIVMKAQQAADEGRPATMRTLIECLPEDGETGNWIRQTAMVCAQSGGRIDEVTVGDVMKATGFSQSTARQYLAQVKHLLRVAATVLATTGPNAHAAGDEE